jgi:hypothetical protein
MPVGRGDALRTVCIHAVRKQRSEEAQYGVLHGDLSIELHESIAIRAILIVEGMVQFVRAQCLQANIAL